MRIAGAGSAFPQHYYSQAVLLAALREYWRGKIENPRMLDQLHGPLTQRGALWCYGASTKGCCLLQYLDSPGSFKAIADRNPAKFGTYMTGSWLPVTNDRLTPPRS